LYNNYCKMTKEEKSKDSIKLSNEFKKEIKGGSNAKWAPVIGLSIAIVVIFGAFGVGTYEIFFQPEKIEPQTINSNEKIQSRPGSEENEADTPKAAEPAVITPAPKTAEPNYIDYTVIEGDTLSGIADKYDTTSVAIAKYNGLDAEAILSIGQKIKIPK